jgi:hypothetical protein
MPFNYWFGIQMVDNRSFEWLTVDYSNSELAMNWSSKDHLDKLAAIRDSIVVWFIQSSFQVIWYSNARDWQKMTIHILD